MEAEKMKLLPCPFDGGEAVMLKAVPGVRSVVCVNGCCYRTSPEEWNTRPPASSEVEARVWEEAASIVRANNRRSDGGYLGRFFSLKAAALRSKTGENR